MIPLFPWLTMFPRGALVVGLIFGLFQDQKGSWQLKPWMQNIGIVPIFIYYALQFSRANPIQPVISVLAIMLAVRLGGEKTVRHSLQIYALSIFCFASSSLFDLSPIFLIYLGLLLFLVTITLVILTFQSQDHTMTVTKADLKRILLSGLLMPVLAVPLLILYFPIMPRTQMPLWHFLTPTPSRTTGYTDTVEPGSQSNITESLTLAFRAEMPSLPLNQLYWRGTVFNRTDGNKWTRLSQIPTEQAALLGRQVRQVIYPEPSTVRTLIALDRPKIINMQRVTSSPDGVFELSRVTGRRLSYDVESQSSDVVTQLNPINRKFYTQLPNRIPARIRTLASTIANSSEDDRARVDFLEKYFRNGDYRYSTKDLATGESAIEQFIFERKKGNCEFFASSFAILLRASGVPCRLVGGYLGGEYNQLGGYYLVTDNKAHVWVEVFVNGSGWVRIDPSSFATNAGDVWTAQKSRSLKLRISLAIDSFNHSWNRSVITYDLERQIEIAHKVGSQLQGFKPSIILRSAAPYLTGALLIAGLLFVVRRFSLFDSREQRILGSFMHMIESKYNIPFKNGEVGLFEMALSLNNSHITEFVSIYAGAIYRDRKLTNDEYFCLRQILQNMKLGISQTSHDVCSEVKW